VLTLPSLQLEAMDVHTSHARQRILAREMEAQWVHAQVCQCRISSLCNFIRLESSQPDAFSQKVAVAKEES